ncbi:hypothetical protein P170DRAFT_465170 [Aspergillus steynii IBT 23096]|uniref:Uncharacterized protein n=1 Tax=Aspergillus steynii IBT 23096 TaxID=1392250 RepID=A0A2I2G3P7_9EURO|nr:uncharacterized protein P170DRAFT_465170 [Aspergillus steynii IBT 23096]PLB47502.1 hypothetical protein P170DRAFT_465170 [Aspergillus steynii IBT 23096]
MGKTPSLLHKIKSNIPLFNKSDILVYEGIPPDVGVPTAATLAEDAVISALDCRINYNSASKELALTACEPVHNLHHTWIKREIGRCLLSGFLVVNEWNAIDSTAKKSESHVPNPTVTDRAILPGFNTFVAPYQSSWRQPEFYLKPRHRVLPTLVVESGWAESYASLVRDKDLWLIGGWPHVNVVFVIQWSRSPRNRVRGRLEVYRRQSGLVQVESIFPEPGPGAVPQMVRLTRNELFDNEHLPYRDTREIVFSVDRLREAARNAFQDYGYIPA